MAQIVTRYTENVITRLRSPHEADLLFEGRRLHG